MAFHIRELLTLAAATICRVYLCRVYFTLDNVEDRNVARIPARLRPPRHPFSVSRLAYFGCRWTQSKAPFSTKAAHLLNQTCSVRRVETIIFLF